jgi:hypothetical protein
MFFFPGGARMAAVARTPKLANYRLNNVLSTDY